MRLCIVGNGVTRDQAPFDDMECEIWTTASVAQNIPRVTRIFEIHDGIYPSDKLNSFGCPVMMKEESNEIPSSEVFPIDDLKEMFGPVFNGTISMILAYSWLMGYNTIELYGIDFSSEDEINRRMMFMYVKGRIEGMGGRVIISPGSHLVDVCRTYQFDANDCAYLDDMCKKASDQLQSDTISTTQLGERMAYCKGILEASKIIRRRNLW